MITWRLLHVHDPTCRITPFAAVAHVQMQSFRGTDRLRSWTRACRGICLALVVEAAVLSAQAPVSSGYAEIVVNSELERYLRGLQLTGSAGLYPWSIRSFSPLELDRLAAEVGAHPWSTRFDLRVDSEPARIRFELSRPRVRSIFNSAFPYGMNDGTVWAGRGLTAAVDLGFLASLGPLSLRIAPVAFHAQNSSFELMPNGRTGRMAFADGRNPTVIDLPQRFGDGAYARIDPGESTLRLDLPGLALGISTASQHWGPARDHPVILGNNAGGYLHGFVGTSAPLDLWVARLHGRMVWGRLEQSDFTTISGRQRRRFMSGLVFLVSPRGVEGLEMGLGRFYHIPWPEGGPATEHLLRPVEAFLKVRRGPQNGGSDPFSTVENQLASVFARWVFPGSGFEIYGEFGRNDHNWDLRDFLLEPDHDSVYLLGFQKAWSSGVRTSLLRGELLNARITHLSRVRHQVPIYRHHATRQGHTQRGQILGSAAAYGGDGAVLGFDRYDPTGRWTIEWQRTLRQERGFNRGAVETDGRAVDVVHSIGVERLFFLGRFDVTGGLRAAQNLNRNHGGDVFNLNATLGVRAGL